MCCGAIDFTPELAAALRASVEAQRLGSTIAPMSDTDLVTIVHDDVADPLTCSATKAAMLCLQGWRPVSKSPRSTTPTPSRATSPVDPSSPEED